MKKPPLLFLCHRIPYPPNKGDKIRSFNMLKYLNESFDVHLGFFVDDPEDMQYVETLNGYCRSLHSVVLKKPISLLKGLTGFLTNKPITLPYYSSRSMSSWVSSVITDQDIDKILVFSSAMAQFVESTSYKDKTRVLDFVDIDSDKWLQYAKNLRGIKKWFYSREAKTLERYEKKMASHFDASVFVSDDEATMFKSMLPNTLVNRVSGIKNGVDVDYFDANSVTETIEGMKEKAVVFTGAMDYWANVNAILWFVEHVWSLVKEATPDVQLYVVGSNPSQDVKTLDNGADIVVTGRVEDVRPYIKQASVSVAPLRIARGIQNKVLEALSMGRPIVLTSMAATGIMDESQDGYCVTDDPKDFAEQIVKLLGQGNQHYEENRQYVVESFSWASEIGEFSALLNNEKSNGE